MLRLAALRRMFLLAGAALVLAAAGSAHAQNTDPVVARVNGAEIKSSDLAIAEEEVGGKPSRHGGRQETRIPRRLNARPGCGPYGGRRRQ